MPASPFVEGLEQKQLRYQRCAGCGTAQTLARHACARCHDRRLEWQVSQGTGVVFAASVVTRAPSEDFRALAPYTLVLVDLAEGFRLMGHAAPGTAIGDRVAAAYFHHQGRTLVRFEPTHD